MSADWPTTGAVPVFQGKPDALELVGYTTLVLDYYPKVRRFMMSKPSNRPGEATLVGEAEVIERDGATGSYLAWLVTKGDPQDMPEFWPV